MDVAGANIFGQKPEKESEGHKKEVNNPLKRRYDDVDTRDEDEEGVAGAKIGANIFGQKPEKESQGQNIEVNNPLKRQCDDVDTRDDEDEEDEDDGTVVPNDRVHISPIELVFKQTKTEVLASKFTGDSALVEVFENMLKSLKKENITSTDAAGFAVMVKQVLENKFFVSELYQQCEDDEDWLLFSGTVNSCGVETTERVNRTPQKEEKTEERMALIRNDHYFDLASVGATRESAVRGVLSMLIGYCISEEDLWNMSVLIGKVSNSKWGNKG